MLRLLAFLALIPTVAYSGETPASLELWKARAEFFWAMDFSDEAKFKSTLKSHWSQIYAGERLQVLAKWIDEGNLESEYFSSAFSDLKDMRVGPFVKIGERRYETETLQSSCYSPDYNPPVLETLVDEYKVTNMTQKEVDSWNSWAWREPRAEICLKTKRRISLELNGPNGLIVGESWNILSSEITLRPNKPSQPTPDGAAERQRSAATRHAR